MIEKTLTIAGFKYGVAAGVIPDNPEAVALLVQDNDSPLLVRLIMSKEEMRQMIEKMRSAVKGSKVKKEAKK